MNALLHGFAKESVSASMHPLSVAVVYEDSDTHRQATAVWEFLIQQLGESGDLTATWWRTSLLGDPKLAKVAARAVSNADLILVSMHAQQEPEPVLKAWVDSLPIAPGARGKLLMILRDRGGESVLNAWVAQLKEWAGRRNVQVLDGTASAFTELPAAPQQTPLPGATLRIEPYVHGGLNE
ncbi:MAG: hypothetical protein AB9869_04275 [Verrucomicrobiia bacterium]